MKIQPRWGKTKTQDFLGLKTKAQLRLDLGWAIISFEKKEELSFYLSAENLLLVNSFKYFETTLYRWFNKCLT
jgi:hypothetical protein